MTKEQAIQVIEQALNLATQKGAFTLVDAQAIINAITVLKTPESNELPAPTAVMD